MDRRGFLKLIGAGVAGAALAKAMPAAPVVEAAPVSTGIKGLQYIVSSSGTYLDVRRSSLIAGQQIRIYDSAGNHRVQTVKSVRLHEAHVE